MTPPTLVDVAVRLTELEHANRRLERLCRKWRVAAWGLILGLGVAACGGAAAGRIAQTVQAQEFVLCDAEGRMRAALAIRPDGTPGLGFFDQGGQVRASIDLGEDGASGINFHDRDGKLRAAVAVRADGTPGVGLFDRKGRPSLAMELAGDETPGVLVYDRDGKARSAAVTLRSAQRPLGSQGLDRGTGRPEPNSR